MPVPAVVDFGDDVPAKLVQPRLVSDGGKEIRGDAIDLAAIHFPKLQQDQRIGDQLPVRVDGFEESIVDADFLQEEEDRKLLRLVGRGAGGDLRENGLEGLQPIDSRQLVCDRRQLGKVVINAGLDLAYRHSQTLRRAGRRIGEVGEGGPLLDIVRGIEILDVELRRRRGGRGRWGSRRGAAGAEGIRLRPVRAEPSGGVGTTGDDAEVFAARWSEWN